MKKYKSDKMHMLQKQIRRNTNVTKKKMIKKTTKNKGDKM